jgi:PPOX class probable F420-dependent enzyme
MRRGLDLSEIGDLLELPTPAALLTYRRDGSALVSPVWFRWDGTAFEVTMAVGDMKPRHLRRDPRTVLTVFEAERPFRAVRALGTAELSRKGVREARLAIASRYLGPDRGERYAEEGGNTGFVMRLGAEHLSVWDFADTFLDD